MNIDELTTPYYLATESKYQNPPKELTELLEKEGKSKTENSEIKALRPKAIKESAQLVALQKAMKWRYSQLLLELEGYGYLLDSAFNFLPLMLVNDQEVMVMPPIITEAKAGFRLENPNLVTTSKTTYEILAQAQCFSSLPNWRVYMMADTFPEAEEPSSALLPQNSEEKALWKNAVLEAWNQGVEEADLLFSLNLQSLVRDYKGVMLYHILVAENLLAKFEMSSSPGISQIADNKMFLEQKVFRITSPTRFQKPKEEMGE